MSIDRNEIFKIKTDAEFETLALQIFKYQYQENLVYRDYCQHLNQTEASVKTVSQIPFLPISFFKTKKVITGSSESNITLELANTAFWPFCLRI